MAEITMEMDTDDEAVLKEIEIPIFPVSELQKFRFDENNNDCYTLFPRQLSITWSDDPNYWRWFSNKDEPLYYYYDKVIEGVELRSVCWLEITGKFDTKFLTKGKTYEVVFKVKLQFPAYGWETPVNLKLVLPNGEKKEKKVSLKDLPMSKWCNIRVGEFVPDESTTGEITFSMFEYEADVWKRGLFLESVTICSKYRI